MENTKIEIKIEISYTSDPVTAIPITEKGTTSHILRPDLCCSIDDLEKGLLQTGFQAIRATISHEIGETAKKKAQEILEQGQTLVHRKKSFEVEGEAGRYWIDVADIKNKKGGTIANPLLSMQPGKVVYLTTGFKEIALFEGACDVSYRKVADEFRRRCYQDSEKIVSYRTLQNQVETESRKVEAEIQSQSHRLLLANGFNTEAVPQNGGSLFSKDLESQSNEKIIQALKELQEECKDTALSKEITPGNVPFEDSDKSTNITIDDVLSKKQKTKRKKDNTVEIAGQEQGMPETQEKKRVYNTVAHISHKGQKYILVAKSLQMVFVFIVAFLLNNGSCDTNLVFFLDGQRSLYTFLTAALSWKKNIMFILDWYHLAEKCKMQLSMALKGKDLRNEALKEILYLSWYGFNDKVCEYIENIPETKIKNKEALEVLKAYYQRNKKYIPNYALRKKLGLRNSSNIGEKANDLVVAKRQKHNGMSWSPEGSNALALLTSIKKNNEVKYWLGKQKINFKFAA